MDPNSISGEPGFNHFTNKELEELCDDIKKIELVYDQDLQHHKAEARKINPNAEADCTTINAAYWIMIRTMPGGFRLARSLR